MPVAAATVSAREIELTDSSRRQLYTVVYDGTCNVCKRLVGVLQKWDKGGELEIVPSQTPGLDQRYPFIPATAYVDSMQLVENASGTSWQGAAALERIIDLLPKGRFITWIFSIPLARPLAEKFYRWFARNRYRMGCSDHCQLKNQ